MKLEKIKNVLSKRQKGTYVQICTEKEITSERSKKLGVCVLKETTMTVRWGINYNNLKSVKEKRASGVEASSYSPWYRHVDVTPHILEKISDPTKKYLQLFPVNRKGYSKTRYFINGVEKTKQEVIDSGYVNKSAFAPKEEIAVFSVAIESIKSIAGQEV